MHTIVSRKETEEGVMDLINTQKLVTSRPIKPSQSHYPILIYPVDGYMKEKQRNIKQRTKITKANSEP